MSNISDPKPTKRDYGMVDDHNETYKPNTKHKFEGWPILWILLVILLVSVILWYTGLASNLFKWITSS